jgi:hypothetical protein
MMIGNVELEGTTTSTVVVHFFASVSRTLSGKLLSVGVVTRMILEKPESIACSLQYYIIIICTFILTLLLRE